ncbi:hypothetical protein KCP78_09695 [Salmonella enterica subsp. enterica]|nr:hypothetical protein KCP78_09695 [Salmonella enterica subsp. enterica]
MHRQLIEGYMLRHKMKPGITGYHGWRRPIRWEKMENAWCPTRIQPTGVFKSDIKNRFSDDFKGFVNKAAY